MQTTSHDDDHHRRQMASTGGDGAFSFPITPVNDDDFQFEPSFLTLDSSISSAAAADHLFLNGRLLPHSFPAAAPSRASTASSLLSSRSNSSASTTARTSSSSSCADADHHRRLTPPPQKPIYRRQCSKPVSEQVYGSSMRWQFMPSLSCRDASRRNRVKKTTKKKKKSSSRRRRRWRIGRRIFRWFVSMCKECHAIEPRPRKDIRRI